MKHLFVYGTLRKGAINARLLDGRATWVGHGCVAGTLYSLGWYPGMVRPTKPKLENGRYVLDTVYGDLYELDADSREETLANLDKYERCSRNDPEPHQYYRGLVQVLMLDGKRVLADAYVMEEAPKGAKLIEHGDFLRWKEEKRNNDTEEVENETD